MPLGQLSIFGDRRRIQTLDLPTRIRALYPLSYATALSAGFEPACIRLEGGGLSIRATRAWRCRPVSSRLMTVLQTAAFPFRHCTGLAPLDGIEPPYLRSERSALPLSERGHWSGWQVTILRPPRPKRGALPAELHPANWPSRQESNLHASRFVAGRSSS